MTRRPRACALATTALSAVTFAGALCSDVACNRPHSGGAGTPTGGSTLGVAVRCPRPGAGCKYLKGICYEGYRDFQLPGGSEPSCNEVAADLRTIAPFTRGIRTYGSRSSQHDGKCIPALTDGLGLDLHMGIWVDSSLPDAQNIAAIDDALGVAQGHRSVKTLIVGNEYMLRVRQTFGDPGAAEKNLVRYIRYARSKAPSGLAVVTAESVTEWQTASRALFLAVDFVVWNAHPWWAGVPIAQAVGNLKTSHEQILAAMQRSGVVKRELLGETGWPWSVQQGEAVGSEANQAQYLHDVDRYSASVGLEYWLFEAFDERWKNNEGPVGGAWGLWPADRNLPGRQIIAGLPIPPTSASLIPAVNMWP
jgi:exo-beta-1,3-glucanase (GH17 family)